MKLNRLKATLAVLGTTALLGAAPMGLGQTAQAEKTETTKVKSSSGTEKSKVHTVSGTVKEFEAGKKVKVATVGKKTRSFSLDDKDVATTVDPDVAVGVKVKVTETTDAQGIKSLKIEKKS